MPSSSARGFTLLEVLVAVAILGLGLTMILSSQVGLFSSASRGEHLTVATNLARCKMAELEVDLLATEVNFERRLPTGLADHVRPPRPSPERRPIDVKSLSNAWLNHLLRLIKFDVIGMS